MQSVLRPLAVLDVEAGSVPFQNFTCSITQRHFAVEHPAVFSIGVADACLVFEDFSGRQTGSPLGHNPLDIVGMNPGCPVPTLDINEGTAQIFKPRPIKISRYPSGRPV